KSGKVTIKCADGTKFKFKLAYSLKLGSDTEFDNIELVNANKSWGAILACGHELTMGEGVTTSIENTNNRAIAIYGGDTGSVTTDYDAHIVLKGGTWRSVYGGHHTGMFGGNSTVEVSNVTMTHKLSAKNETGTFNGEATLIADLRGNKTVTSASYLEIPTFLVDDGYEAVLDGTTYKQVPSAQVVDTVYVDGIGTAENTYATLEEAIAALPMDGGKVIVCSDTIAVLQGATKTLPEKNGTVLIEGSDPSVKITLRGWLILGSATTFSNLTLYTDLDANIAIYANGNLLTVEENVLTARADGARWIRLFGGTRGQDTEYDTHLVVKAGTYRDIFGGSDWQNITGSSVIELSNTAVELKVTNAGNVGGGKGYVTGTHELILDLRGGKTVSAATFAETPTTILVDEGYVATLDGTIYKQVKETTTDTVYLDGTGATDGAYTTLEAAISMLPDEGGTVIVCGDTAMVAGSELILPAKSGKVTIKCADGTKFKFKLAYSLKLGSDTEFDNIELVNANKSWGAIL
ncbi:MAG: hypothetical protein IJB94_08005, partial [Clostridia bacterium]|nr:hypothetical protein [Clostridia bacterium]